jgi:pSer/pThr/pTyr-binding forkhead associated (FHA) protein
MALLEILQPRGYTSVTLDGDRLTIGKSDDNDLAIADDPTLSRHHALLERIGAAWSVSDLGAKNGTLVNGQRVVGTQVLKHGDELTLGETRLGFHDQKSARDDTTKAKDPPPRLTPTEREVLVELVRPWATGNAFTPPALAKEIAARRFTTEAAVKNHLGRMYDKFGIDEDGTNRRVRLANAAWESGAVGPRDLHANDEADG